MDRLDLIIESVLNEYLDKNMSSVRKKIKQAKDDWGDNWASEPYGEDDREIIHDEWMIHFSSQENISCIGKEGFTHGNSYKEANPNQVTYNRTKEKGGYNYAYLATDVVEAMNAKTDVELNDLYTSFMYHLMEEQGNSFVMFKGNGYRFFHVGDAENQVVFNSIQEDTKVVVYRVGNKYCVMNDTNVKPSKTQYKKSEGGYNVGNYTKNPKNEIDNILYFSSDIRKIISWVMTNYAQYRKNFKY